MNYQHLLILFQLLLVLSGTLFSQGHSKRDSLLNAIERSENDSVKAWQMILLGQEFEQSGDSIALAWFEKAAQLAASHKDKPEYIDLQGNAQLRSAIFLLRANGSKERAKKHLNQAKELFTKTANQLKIADVFTTLGIVEYYAHNYDESIGHHLLSLAILKETTDTARLARAYNNLGLSCSEANKLEEAVRAFQQAIRLNEALGNIPDNGWLYSNIGAIYSKLEYYKKAKEYFQRSLGIMKQYGNELQLASIMNNLGSAYRELQQRDSAALLFEKAREISSRLGNQEIEIMAINNLGIIHSDEKRFGQARQHFENALDISKSSGQTYQVVLTLGNLAMVMNKTGDHERAIAFSEEALALCDSIHADRSRIELYQNLADAYESLGDADLSLKYLSLKVALEDSLNSGEQREAMLKAENEFEVLKRQNEIERQKTAWVQQEAKAEIQQTRIIALFIGLGLTSLIIVILFRLYRLQSSRHAELQSKNRLIIEQKDQIESQRHELEKLNQNKDKLFSILSHDLISPFGSLKMLLNLTRTHKLGHEDIHHLLADLNEIASANYGFIENLLHWSKNQLEGLTPHKRDFLLGPLVEETVGLFKYQAQHKEITIVNKTGGDIPLHSDPDLVQLVVRNLVANAIKFSHKAGMVTVDARLQDGQVFVSVTDQGTGIPAQKVESLFNFTGQSKRGTANEPGTGLGLTLCKEVVHLLGGEIWVRSVEGEGSCFEFRIPQKEQ